MKQIWIVQRDKEDYDIYYSGNRVYCLRKSTEDNITYIRAENGAVEPECSFADSEKAAGYIVQQLIKQYK